MREKVVGVSRQSESRSTICAMVSRKRNKGKTRRALKAEMERFAKAKAEAERAKAAEAEKLESLAVRLMREEAAAAVERKSPQKELEDANKNIFGSDNLSPDEALVTLTRKRRGLFTSFSRYDIHVGGQCVHGLVPWERIEGFVNAFIHEFNLIYGRLNVLRDSDAITFAMQTLSAAFKFTQEKYDTVWYDPANLNWTISFFLANGTQHLLDGNDSCARDCAFISYAFEQRVAVGFNRSRAAYNLPKLCELLMADKHTLVSFFRKRINCSCLDELYKKVKSIPKIGLCYNPNCKHGRVVTRSKTKCCSQCRGANYCSRRCQSAHWPRHRKACIETAAVLSKLRE
mmetsp:Transcript_25022/g.49936  ORF Transcript_25022/g.49936 Transcript_25022/m.49936 type:complete len:344 (+) Transcript_25022:763-1794(+)